MPGVWFMINTPRLVALFTRAEPSLSEKDDVQMCSPKWDCWCEDTAPQRH